jgi:hypothetical protein
MPRLAFTSLAKAGVTTSSDRYNDSRVGVALRCTPTHRRRSTVSNEERVILESEK